MKFEKDLIEDLKKLGLKDLEAKVYLTLLRLKNASVSQIAKETQVHRRSVYDNLNILIRKGLVSELIKSKVKFFECLPPENLKIIIEEQQNVLDKTLPSLKSFYNHNNEDVKVQVYSGDNALKMIFEEVSTQKGKKYWLGGGTMVLKRYSNSVELLIKKFFESDIILLQPLTKRLSTISLLVPKEKFRVLPAHLEGDQGVLITQNNVMIGILTDNQTTIIKITSKASVKAFKKYFDLMWQMSKEITDEQRKKASQNPINELI